MTSRQPEELTKAQRQKRYKMSYHTVEGLVCSIGPLTLAAVGYGMSHTGGVFWAYLALAGMAGLFSVFYLRSRK
jgi:hypothetical protein